MHFIAIRLKDILAFGRTSAIAAVAAIFAASAGMAADEAAADDSRDPLKRPGGAAYGIGWNEIWSVDGVACAFALASIPTLMVVNHLFYLHTVKRKAIDHRPDNSSRDIESRTSRDDINENSSRNAVSGSDVRNDWAVTRAEIATLRKKSVATYEEYFEFNTLLKRYGLPSLLLFLTVMCVILAAPMVVRGGLPFQGYCYGAVGAYVYVLMSLGYRNMRSDILPGFVAWCAAQMLLGGILGVVLSETWPQSGGEAHANQNSAPSGLLFLAGLSPRFVITAVQDTLRRVWFSGVGSAASNRALPLNHLRGINPAIEDRLMEEGVFDTYTMAMSNPLKLFRNTPFDRRQILAWIDEALLIYVLPASWQLFENEGITGAIDLSWIYYQVPKASDHERHSNLVSSESFKKLAERVKMDADMLADTIERLTEDAQLRQVWALYQDEVAHQ